MCGNSKETSANSQVSGGMLPDFAGGHGLCQEQAGRLVPASTASSLLKNGGLLLKKGNWPFPTSDFPAIYVERSVMGHLYARPPADPASVEAMTGS